MQEQTEPSNGLFLSFCTPSFMTNRITVDQCRQLFARYPHLISLEIEATQVESSDAFDMQKLDNVLCAASHLPLQQLKITFSGRSSAEALPDSLWQWSKTLKKLELKNFPGVKSISDKLGSLVGLESFVLENFFSLESLPDALDQLKNLRYLNLNSALSLRTLPASLGQLNQLEVLILHDLPRLAYLPQEISALQELKKLELFELRSVVSIPEQLWQLTKLETLILVGFEAVEKLSDNIHQLQALRFLILSIEHLRALPEALAKLPHLKQIHLPTGASNLSIPPVLKDLIVRNN
jgi:hypothetical protein